MEPLERREQILHHAAVLFGQNGYHSTSITNIIESAGIARGTFYLYFKNKRAIFDELLDYLVILIKRQIRTVDTSEGAPSPRQQLLDNITGVIGVLTQNRALLSILLEGAVGLDKGFADKLANFYEQIANTIELSLKLGYEMKLVRPCNTRMVSVAVVGALKEVLHDMLRSGDENIRVNSIAVQILDMFSIGVLEDGATIP